MAKVSGQLKDASINGKPRDLMNMIFDISPTDTPFLTACGKSSASQTLHEWQTDILNAPAKNAQLEGDDAKNFEASNTTELTNKTQILSKNISVSGTAQAVKQAGVSKQYNYQLAQRMKEIKKDLELALLSNQIEGNDNGTSQGRTMRGLPCWMTETANISLGASGVHTLSFGLGYNTFAQFPDYDLKYAASAAFRMENTLLVKIQIIDSAIGNLFFSLNFKGDYVTVMLRKIEESLFGEYNGVFSGRKI